MAKESKESKEIKFNDITASMEEKLGKENVSLIADDMASLISYNSEREKTLQDKDAQIKKLQSDKEMLITANGNLLQQVNAASEEVLKPKIKEEPEEKKPFNFRSVFDSKGNFKRDC